MGGGTSPLVTMRPAPGSGFSCADLAGCSLAALGTKHHHLLTELDHDDHPHYALADRSRPSPWIGPDDLWTHSITEFSTRHHHDLQFLATDDHPVYINIYGRPGGQTVLGATGVGEHLTLQSTSHATRGYVRVQDALQLLNNIIRDSGGNVRITLATSTPEVSVAGDLVGGNHMALGGTSIHSGRVLNLYKSLAVTPAAQGASIGVVGIASSGVQITAGVSGGVTQAGTPTVGFALGLDYTIQHNTPSTLSQLIAIHAALSSGASGSGAIASAWGVLVRDLGWGGSKPITLYGIEVQHFTSAGVTTAYGLKIGDLKGATTRLLELGPTVPYLRLLGNSAPGGNGTNLWLAEGATPTLRQLKTKDGAAIGGGDLVCVLV